MFNIIITVFSQQYNIITIALLFVWEAVIVFFSSNIVYQKYFRNVLVIISGIYTV